MNLLGRLKGVAVAEDEALNALGGGSPLKTISGTVGRACGYGGGRLKRWGPPLAAALDWAFGRDHCRLQAEREAAIPD